jgi:hypothetical protein
LSLGFTSGLAGWTTPDDNPFLGDPGTVTSSGMQATLNESTSAFETDLIITFTVPTGASELLFNLVSFVPNSTVPNSDAGSGYAPAAFGASLLDPNTGLPLVPTVIDPTDGLSHTDSFYTRDLASPITAPGVASGASESTSVTGVFSQVSVDIPSILVGQQAEVLFRLLGSIVPPGETNSDDSSVTLSDVKIITNQGQVGVPEPSNFFMAGLGVLVWLGYGLHVRRSKRGRA